MVNKVVDKLRGISRIYIKTRNKVEIIGWGINIGGYNKPVIQDATQTIKAYILDKYRWYYDYETLFNQNPNVIAPFLSESGQLDRINIKLPGYEDKDNKITDNKKAPEDKKEQEDK